jgi:hypothetical protein
LTENGHCDIEKCTVDPTEARSLSEAQGVHPEAGFWLIAPRRATSDVRLFCANDRCNDATTTIMLPEHNTGYPAAKGSMVLVRKGNVYGVGVLDTEVFDQHVQEGRPCCKNLLVILRSTKAEGPSARLTRQGSEYSGVEDSEAESEVESEIDFGHTPMGPKAAMTAGKRILDSCRDKSKDSARSSQTQRAHNLKDSARFTAPKAVNNKYNKTSESAESLMKALNSPMGSAKRDDGLRGDYVSHLANSKTNNQPSRTQATPGGRFAAAAARRMEASKFH